MDQFDQATHHEELHRGLASAIRMRVEPHKGFCLNCKEPSGTPFCDTDCKADYERMKDAEKRNGRK